MAIVDMGGVNVSGGLDINHPQNLGKPQRNGQGQVPIEAGNPMARNWLDKTEAYEAIRQDPSLLRCQQVDIFSAWHRIMARNMAQFFGTVVKVESALICDYPSMFVEVALLGADGRCNANNAVRVGMPLDKMHDVIGMMQAVYSRACRRYKVKKRPISEARFNISGAGDPVEP